MQWPSQQKHAIRRLPDHTLPQGTRPSVVYRTKLRPARTSYTKTQKCGTKKAIFAAWIIFGDREQGDKTMAFVVLGIVIGGSCALLRRRVCTMMALTVLVAVVAALGGISLHSHPWVIAAQVFGSVIALQFVYAAVSLAVHLVRFRKLIPHVQTVIGRRLRAELEVPRNLPPELSALVAQLQAA
jgi:hypothetical protein